MLKFEIRNSIVNEEIVIEDDLELVSNFGVDTVKMILVYSSNRKIQPTINFLFFNITKKYLILLYNYKYQINKLPLQIQIPLYINIYCPFWYISSILSYENEL
jgi:hypothetical protein